MEPGTIIAPTRENFGRSRLRISTSAHRLKKKEKYMRRSMAILSGDGTSSHLLMYFEWVSVRTMRLATKRGRGCVYITNLVCVYVGLYRIMLHDNCALAHLS